MKTGFRMAFNTFYNIENGRCGMVFGYGSKKDMLELAQKQFDLPDNQTAWVKVIRNKDEEVVFELNR